MLQKMTFIKLTVLFAKIEHTYNSPFTVRWKSPKVTLVPKSPKLESKAVTNPNGKKVSRTLRLNFEELNRGSLTTLLRI